MTLRVDLVPYRNNDAFLKDLEDAICDITGETIVPRRIIEESGKNIDHFLGLFI